VLITGLEARSFRSLSTATAELGPGITTIAGPNGAGKTSLLEAVYFALTGRSFRTRDRRELIAYGESVARAAADLEDGDGTRHVLLASVSRAEGRRHGSPAAPAESSRARPHITVFSPDLLSLAKGPPAERRAHLDEFVGVRWPARAELRRSYGQTLAQRNALLGRVAAGRSPARELDAWDRALAEAADPLIAARREAAAELAPPFAAAADDLGLSGEPRLAYVTRAEGGADAIAAELAARRDSDLQRSRTGFGPHLDELALTRHGRQLRRYGSQGEQRMALLALLFAEREALLAAGESPPLMLLDDVMSELDPTHRELLVGRLGGAGQALISAADQAAVPASANAKLIRLGEPGPGALHAVA
jgi:DNA replication and repair protein RecF